MLVCLRKFNVGVFLLIVGRLMLGLFCLSFWCGLKRRLMVLSGIILGRGYWFGCFRRKICIVSCCKHLVDLTLSLFACFRVNGTPDMIASFLT
jgi:hypothetical protein